MRMSVEKLTEEALALPADARALLADRLAESLDPSLDEDLRAIWAVEAMVRRDEVRSRKVKTVPSEVVFSRVRKRLNG
jgi:putative addiction module component (TIGR02574 family)